MGVLERLKELEVYEQFIKNCKEDYKTPDQFWLYDTITFSYCFNWERTPEGHMFWFTVAKKLDNPEFNTKELITLFSNCKLPKCYREL